MIGAILGRGMQVLSATRQNRISMSADPIFRVLTQSAIAGPEEFELERLFQVGHDLE
jgi:hypothetical protein